jgi:hypothetical protein
MFFSGMSASDLPPVRVARENPVPGCAEHRVPSATPHTSGVHPPPPTGGRSPGRGGGVLGLGGRRPSRLSMNPYC